MIIHLHNCNTELKEVKLKCFHKKKKTVNKQNNYILFLLFIQVSKIKIYGRMFCALACDK